MNEWIASVSPTLLVIIAAAAVSRIIATAVNWAWRKVGKPALDASLLAEIRAEVKAVNHRLNLEFANGVPPDDDTYIPFRKTVELAQVKHEEAHETLFEMVGQAHNWQANTSTIVARHELWMNRHEAEHKGNEREVTA